MEYSRVVKEALACAERYTWNRHYEASRVLKNAAEDAADPQDAHMLSVLSGALSMSFVDSTQEFSPMIVLADGHRSFAMEDIQQEDFEIFEDALNAMEAPWIRVQLSHILWVLSDDHRYGQIAVESRIELFNQTFDPEQWVECHDAIKPAVQIARKLGKSSDSFKNVVSTINQALFSMDGSDPLFLSLNLLELVYKDVGQQDLEKYVQILNNLADKNIREGNENFNLAKETYAMQEQVLNRLKRKDDVRAATENLADYYIAYAEALEEKGDDFRAIMLLKKACTLYRSLDKSKLLELRKWLEVLQQKSLQNMKSIPFSFDVTNIRKAVEQSFRGLTIQEAIIQLGRITRIYKVDEVKGQVIKEQGEFIFKSMFGSSLLNEKGQTFQDVPPLDRENPSSDSELLFKHMVLYVSRQRDIEGSTVLSIAFEIFRNMGEISKDTLNCLVENNSIIPEGRSAIIKDGLHMGLSGNLYAAMHILLPQTENIIRHLVKMCGDTVTFLNPDGTEGFKSLSQLFKSEKLRECYSEDIIFSFQSIMDVPVGENLRNLSAHGILEPQMGNSTKALCFLCLLIKLLSLYGASSRCILSTLIEKSDE